MSVIGILIATLIVGGVGLFIGLFLGLSEKVFAVEVNEKEEAILAVLPGNNCGGCGYAGCAGLAQAIAEGKAEVNACPVGGAAVAQVIAEIMGVETNETMRVVAFVKCAGTCEKAVEDYQYYGVQDCKMMAYVQNGGPKSCDYGCMGYGSCVKACPFDAIHIVDKVAVVDKDACKACGRCVATCPKKLIEFVPYEQTYRVQCNSQSKGKVVMNACKAGCIGCKLCEKVCLVQAIQVENNLAHINYDLCTNCGMCAKKCPRKIIISTERESN